MKLPEKVTTYGGPKDPFVKVVETFKRVGATIVARSGASPSPPEVNPGGPGAP